MKDLRLAARSVNEVRVDCAEITSKFVEGFAAHEYSGRHVQHAVFGVQFIDCCAAAARITLAEDLLKIAMKQCVDTVKPERRIKSRDMATL